MCDGQGRHTLQVATCGQAGELVMGKHAWMAREEEGRHTLQEATCGQAGELVIGKHAWMAREGTLSR